MIDDLCINDGKSAFMAQETVRGRLFGFTNKYWHVTIILNGARFLLVHAVHAMGI